VNRKRTIRTNQNGVQEDDDEDVSPNEVYPNPQSWIDQNVIPYAYFAIGNTTGCSAHHFHNMSLIFNLAFCGNVAGNRFLLDHCGSTTATTSDDNVTSLDPIQACNEYIKAQPKDLDEAYWAIRGVYIYERSMENLGMYSSNVF
jgi:hypothetical protein